MLAHGPCLLAWTWSKVLILSRTSSHQKQLQQRQKMFTPFSVLSLHVKKQTTLFFLKRRAWLKSFLPTVSFCFKVEGRQAHVKSSSGRHSWKKKSGKVAENWLFFRYLALFQNCLLTEKWLQGDPALARNLQKLLQWSKVKCFGLSEGWDRVVLSTHDAQALGAALKQKQGSKDVDRGCSAPKPRLASRGLAWLGTLIEKSD